MVSVIESLELEELNPTERMNYRPVWNRMLPVLEGSGSSSRRTISSPEGRYRLAFDAAEPGSVISTIHRAFNNAESVLETLSLDAWAVMSGLRARFDAVEFRPDAPPEALASASREFCLLAREMIPRFFGTAKCTMLADDGWNFCEIGQLLERAAITANAVTSIAGPLLQPSRLTLRPHAVEIRLSAFLRLLNSRDIYRRVYQMRIEPHALLELLWTNPVAPRSVAGCLQGCAALIRTGENVLAPATDKALATMDNLLQKIRASDWEALLEAKKSGSSKSPLQRHSESLLESLLGLHTVICDSFLNHQVLMHEESKTAAAAD